MGDSPQCGHGWVGKKFGLALFKNALSASEGLRHHELWAGHLALEIAKEPQLSDPICNIAGAGLGIALLGVSSIGTSENPG